MKNLLKKMQKNKEKIESRKSITHAAFLLVLVMFTLLNFACGSSSGQKNSNPTNASPEVKLTSIERDIKSMRTANFDYIFVFRRKDGGVLAGEDKTFLKANSPPETNRFVLSDDDKAVVAGSSFEFKPEILKKLEERFIIENYSSVKKTENDNSNQSTDNKNVNKTTVNK